MQKVHSHFLKKLLLKTKYSVSSSYFNSPFGSISPFPHGTSSLSKYSLNLTFEGSPPFFGQINIRLTLGLYFLNYTGLSPSLVKYSKKTF